MKTCTFHTVTGYRCREDPVFKGAREHFFQVQLCGIPHDINTKTNPRIPDPLCVTYKIIKRAQRNEVAATRSAYHTMSSPLTLITTSVAVSSRASTVKCRNNGPNGLIDGGNQYHAFLSNSDWFMEPRRQHGQALNQYANVRVLENYPKHLLPHIIKGLNTHTAIKEGALLNMVGAFDAIKEVLEEQDLLKHFGCLGNEKRVKKLKYDITACVALLVAMNRVGYPDGSKHPVSCVGQPWSQIRNFGHNGWQKFAGVFHLLPDFWRLYERICKDVPLAVDKRKLDLVSYVNGPKLQRKDGTALRRKPKVYQFPIIGEAGTATLYHGGALAALSAFRQLITVSARSGTHQWEIPFEQVLQLFDECKSAFAKIADDVTLGGKADASAAFKGDDMTRSWTRFYDCVAEAHKRPRRRSKATIKGNVVHETSMADRVRAALREELKKDPQLENVSRQAICKRAEVRPSGVRFSQCVQDVKLEAGVVD